jgi:hypothetical protein
MPTKSGLRTATSVTYVSESQKGTILLELAATLAQKAGVDDQHGLHRSCDRPGCVRDRDEDTHEWAKKSQQIGKGKYYEATTGAVGRTKQHPGNSAVPAEDAACDSEVAVAEIPSQASSEGLETRSLRPGAMLNFRRGAR